MTEPVPTPDEIASLLQVEHLLDQRWPETKLEPSTTRIAALMELLGSPQRGYPSIHIAGTNGKTSVARMVDALLTAFSRRTGRTTSPHLQSAVERISIDGQPISPAKYVETYREIEPFVQLVDQQSEATGGPAMSKFEVVTAMAFAAFADAPVDVAVVEVGLGGRWDATNVVDAPVAVITPVGVDHADYLGDTVADIAGEKAGVIKKQEESLVPTETVAVIARQLPEAMEVLLAQAVRADAAVAREDSEFAVLGRQIAVGGQLLELQGLGGRYSDIYLPLHGSIRRTTPSSRWPPSRRSSGRVRNGSWTSRRYVRASHRSPVPDDLSGCAVPQPFSSTPRTTRPAPSRLRKRCRRNSTSGSSSVSSR